MGITPEEKVEMIKTARSKGAVGENAIVPRVVLSMYNSFLLGPNHTVLDFGCGDGQHVKLLRGYGLRVNGCDFQEYPRKEWGVHHFTAVNELYDLVYASNVLNVQPNLGCLQSTLRQIKSCVISGGLFVCNYPKEPRKMQFSERAMEIELRKMFSSVSRISTIQSCHVWICVDWDSLFMDSRRHRKGLEAL